MKNAKKVFAMLIVLALAISMAIPVSAASGTITIDPGASDKETYKAYKMADLDYIAATQGSGAKYAYTVASDSPWRVFWTENAAATAVFDVQASVGDASTYVITAKTGVANVSDKMVAFAKAAITYAEGNNTIKGQAKTAVKSGNNMVISGLEDGYYVVDTTMGTFCSIDTVAGQGNVDIEEKNAIPQIGKSITNINNAASFTETDTATVKIGDIVEYTIEIPVEAGAINYKVVDTLAPGLTLVKDETGASVTASNWKDAFDVSAGITFNNESTFANNVITLVLDGEENLVGETITITYYAQVNENAVVDGDNINDAKLYYGQKSSYTHDTVNVSSLSFTINKIDGQTQGALAGAEFELYEGSTKLNFTEQADGSYLYDEDGTAVLTSGDDGKIIIKGLSDGSYTIKETKAPAGYNILLNELSQELSAEFNANESLKSGAAI
ncbi:MAG: isopeptide-forming domain-containing fimbrial protein [Clostridia bacterium]|nr:isopeptide-forming domain-containing fimbrial protein [Clostridia bacterium]